MQISLPVHSVNCYLVVCINTIACLQPIDKAQFINNINYLFLNNNLDKNKLMKNVTLITRGIVTSVVTNRHMISVTIR